MAEKNETIRFTPLQHRRVAFLAFEVVLGISDKNGVSLALRRVFDALQDL